MASDFLIENFPLSPPSQQQLLLFTPGGAFRSSEIEKSDFTALFMVH